MILQALDTIHVSSVSSDNIITGQTFEIDDLRGRSLIERGLAYVDEQTPEEMRHNRGDFATPGTDSPYRDRSVDENLVRLREMLMAAHKPFVLAGGPGWTPTAAPR